MITDVIYLGGGQQLDRNVIYLYRSGVMRQAMRSQVEAAATREGLTPSRCAPSDFLAMLESGGGLLNPSPCVICDWGREPIPLTRGAIDRILQQLAAPGSTRAALLLPSSSHLTTREIWSNVEACSLVVEEALITRKTLVPALRVLEMGSDLVGRNQCSSASTTLCSQPAFVQSFEELFEEENVSWPSLARAFDERALLRIDRVTNVFQPPSPRSVSLQKARESRLDLVRQLVDTRESKFVPLIVSALDAWQQGGEAAGAVVREFYRITGYVLRSPSREKTSDRRRRSVGTSAFSASPRDVALWGALALAWESRLVNSARDPGLGYRRTPDFLAGAIDRLCRDFLARADQKDDWDLLDGLWTSLIRTLEEVASAQPGGIAEARRKTVEDLAQHLLGWRGRKPHWIVRLQRAVNDAIQAANDVARDVEPESQETPNHALLKAGNPKQSAYARAESLDDIFGQRNAVQGLRQRIIEEKHRTGLILHGPAGAGKRTIARLYAKAVLCEAGSKTTGSSCNACRTCTMFDARELPEYIELDVGDGNAADRARALVRKAKDPLLWTDRRAIVLTNVDVYAPAVFDTLLKTLEEMPDKTTFMLLGSNLSDIRLAGQSRCEIYRIRPLTEGDARQLGRVLFAAFNLPEDGKVLDLVVAASGGLPGRLRTICEELARLPELNLDVARVALGLDWINEAAAAWPAVLRQETLAFPENGNVGIPWNETVRRIRVILHGMKHRLHGLEIPGAFVDPALLYREDELIGMIGALRTEAEHRGISWAELWLELVRTSLDTDYGETAAVHRKAEISRTAPQHAAVAS